MRWYSLVTLRACLREVTREEDGTMAMDFRIKTKGKGKMEPMRATKPRRLLLPMFGIPKLTIWPRTVKMREPAF